MVRTNNVIGAFILTALVNVSAACDYGYLKDQAEFIDHKIWEGAVIPKETVKERLGFLPNEVEAVRNYGLYVQKEKFDSFVGVVKDIIHDDGFRDFCKTCVSIYNEGSIKDKVATFLLFEEIAHVAVPHYMTLQDISSYRSGVSIPSTSKLTESSPLVTRFHELSPKFSR